MTLTREQGARIRKQRVRTREQSARIKSLAERHTEGVVVQRRRRKHHGWRRIPKWVWITVMLVAVMGVGTIIGAGAISSFFSFANDGHLRLVAC